MLFWQGRGEERTYRQHAGHADKDKLRDPSAGRCGGNVPIHIIDKRISDLFIKPTVRRETENLSRRCRRTLSGKSITPKWCKYEWSPEGLVRMTSPCIAWQRERLTRLSFAATSAAAAQTEFPWRMHAGGVGEEGIQRIQQSSLSLPSFAQECLY